MYKKKRELSQKIKEGDRLRRIAIFGLVAGVILTVIGQLLPFPAFFIIGYTVFIICTGVISFLTVFRWFYSRTIREQATPQAKPDKLFCPRCGADIVGKLRFCPKCGKKLQTKKH